MSEHLILQQDNPDFPLDPQLLIHAMWKELFDLEIMDFMIWPFEYGLVPMMHPTSIRDCDHQFDPPQTTTVFYDPETSGLILGVPDWVKRFRYDEFNLEEALEVMIGDQQLAEAFTWPWVLWSIYAAERKGEIVLNAGSNVIDLLEEDEFQNALANEGHGFISQELVAQPVSEPGPAFEGFTYSGKEAEEALPVIQSFLALEAPGSTPDDNAYCHALMLFAVHPHSTPASLELIAQSGSAAREFLKFNPSVTPELFAKVQ
jgi:hypothetical protein